MSEVNSEALDLIYGAEIEHQVADAPRVVGRRGDGRRRLSLCSGGQERSLGQRSNGRAPLIASPAPAAKRKPGNAVSCRAGQPRDVEARCKGPSETPPETRRRGGVLCRTASCAATNQPTFQFRHPPSRDGSRPRRPGRHASGGGQGDSNNHNALHTAEGNLILPTFASQQSGRFLR